MRRACLPLGLALAMGACAATSGAALTSGIDGRLVAGPTCPVETISPQPRCAPRPLAASLIVRRAGAGAPAVTVRSSATGRFRVRLAPGSYVVEAQAKAGSPFPRPPAPRTVRVHARSFTSITIIYDTGIR
ncbi:MAG TPA: hypothetical protein VG186_08240 [Solirubrobacteraceae bacterium]|jgi:hypothetical protein|nr:hypothetical protein [Solirubrobacteraceae bacterium]